MLAIPVALLVLLIVPALAGAQDRPITIRAGTLLDGRGNALRNVTVEVRGSRIVKVDSSGQTATYDLRGLTVLPGLIDTHVHIGFHFGKDGRADNRDETPAQAALYGAESAFTTLMAGFTTVQSVGSASDKDLRDAIARGSLPGPRILTSLGSLNDRTGTPAEIRAFVRQKAVEGADVIKIFASKSIREGGAKTMTDEQLGAACGEAKTLTLRTLVHGHSADSVIAAAKAGCTQVEHGAFVNDEAILAMAERGVYFDPNIGVVLQNYLENKPKFLGIGNYTEEGFAYMEKAVATNIAMFKRAIANRKLKIVMGTDAVAGAHGRNAEELVVRVRNSGQSPRDAIVSATSLAAESLGLKDTLGAIASGLEADIIAVDGDPLQDITALGRVVFVMKGGTVFKNMAPGRKPGTNK